MLQYIDADALPVKYGGTLKCNLENPESYVVRKSMAVSVSSVILPDAHTVTRFASRDTHVIDFSRKQPSYEVVKSAVAEGTKVRLKTLIKGGDCNVKVTLRTGPKTEVLVDFEVASLKANEVWVTASSAGDVVVLYTPSRASGRRLLARVETEPERAAKQAAAAEEAHMITQALAAARGVAAGSGKGGEQPVVDVAGAEGPGRGGGAGGAGTDEVPTPVASEPTASAESPPTDETPPAE